MKPVLRALDEGTQVLRTSSDTPRLDAELLMAEALEIDRDRLLLDPPSLPVPPRFAGMIDRRAAGEPVAYITGRRAFWNIELHVGPGVLVPRPDSEVLIASAIEHFEGTAGPARVLDLGTGPGTLLLAALDVWPRATGVGIDMSLDALAFAEANARRLGIDRRALFRQGNWADSVDEKFDLVLCNPPYIRDSDELGPGVREYEPAEALFAGDDGLAAYRVLAPQLPRLIAHHGLAAVEIGSDQARDVVSIMEREKLAARLVNDLGDRPRAVLLQACHAK